MIECGGRLVALFGWRKCQGGGEGRGRRLETGDKLRNFLSSKVYYSLVENIFLNRT
jgi:hypothetical protein